MKIDINEKCCIKSDLMQWIVLPKNRPKEKDWHAIAYFRTLDFALDTLVTKELCTEWELRQARKIAKLLKDTEAKIIDILSDRNMPIPEEVQKFGCFMTAASGVNYAFLKTVWKAENQDEIPEIAKTFLNLATNTAQKCASKALEPSGSRLEAQS